MMWQFTASVCLIVWLSGLGPVAGQETIRQYLGGGGKADAVEVTMKEALGKFAGKPVAVPVAAGRVTTKVNAPELWTVETAQTGPQATTALVSAPYQSTVYLRFRGGHRDG